MAIKHAMEDSIPVLRASELLSTVELHARDVIARAVALQDALDMASVRASHGSTEAPLLSNLKARIAAVQGPIDGILHNLIEGLPTIRKCVESLQTISAREHSLRKKAQVVEAAHGVLDEDRLQFQLARDEFDRRRTVDSQLSAREGEGPTTEFRRQLKDTENRLSRATASLEEKTLLALGLQEELAIMKNDITNLKKDLSRQRKRTITEGERLGSQLKTVQATCDKHAEELAAERKKNNALQTMLQRETARGQGVSSTHTSVRAVSASTTAMSRRHRNVEDVVRQNEALLLDLAAHVAENKRLRQDNAHLLEHAKGADEGRALLLAQVTTSNASRIELQRRLDKVQGEVKVLQQQLRSQAESLARRNRDSRQKEEDRRWASVTTSTSTVAIPVRARMRIPARSASKHRSVRVEAW